MEKSRVPLIKNNVLKFIKTYGPDRICDILDYFNVEYHMSGHEIRCSCPIHKGDNPIAWSWLCTQNIWKCWTKECHQAHGSDIIGLICGIKQCGFVSAVKFLRRFLNEGPKRRLKTSKTSEQLIATFTHNKKTLSEIIPLIKLDDFYYHGRGISKEVIQRYYIGVCDDPGKKFYKRVYMPILDEHGHFVVGYTARSIYEKCRECEGFHNPNYLDCPDNPKMFPKWKHSKGFRKKEYLFNYWFAKHHIKSQKAAIICEGPGDIFALEQAGIKNSIAIFGKSISEQQRLLLQKAGAERLYIGMDSDEAGQIAKEKMKKELYYYFDLQTIIPNKKDFGCMTSDEIRNLVTSQI